MYKIPATTLFFGKNLLSVRECSSTNTALAERARSESLVEGTVLITDSQTAGRGWGVKTRWEADPSQNLTFSLLLRPNFLRSENHFLLSAAVAVGLCNYLRRLFGERTSIKWPNDLLVDRKKVCGVLIENQIRGGHFVQSIVGIGLNVNQAHFSAPLAASLHGLTGEVFDLNVALESVLTDLEVAYRALRVHGAELTRKNYLEALFGRGKSHTFERSEGPLEAILRGVDEVGRLQLEAHGEMLYFEAKQVKLLL